VTLPQPGHAADEDCCETCEVAAELATERTAHQQTLAEVSRLRTELADERCSHRAARALLERNQQEASEANARVVALRTQVAEHAARGATGWIVLTEMLHKTGSRWEPNWDGKLHPTLIAGQSALADAIRSGETAVLAAVDALPATPEEAT